MDQTYCGIDVSKQKLDVFVDGRTWTVDNDTAGFARLVADLPTGTTVVLEPTGPYHRAVVAALRQRTDVVVRLVNPQRARRFVQARGRGDKTDALDAQALADFGRLLPDAAPAAPSPETLAVQPLHARLRQIEKDLAAQRCRIEQTDDPLCQQQIQAVIDLLQQQHDTLEDRMDAAIEAAPQLRDDARLLRSIPGVGPMVTRMLLCQLPALPTFKTAGQLAAFVGLAPVVRQSGTSFHFAVIGAGGKPDVRAGLYFPTMAAIRYNPDIRAFYLRLVARGKPKKVALVAAMHKLLRICYGVLKHQQPFKTQCPT